jgi:hypothetical protein
MTCCRGGWGETQVVEEYGYLLERGLTVGRFLQWFADVNE